MSVSLESLMREPATAAPRASILGELFSFVAIGGLAALGFIALSTLMIGLRTGVPDWLVSACCYALFVGPVYLAHKYISFHSDAPHRQALPRYVVVQVCGIGFASLFSFLAYGVLGLPTLTAAVLVIGLTSGVNFAVVRVWAFAGAD